MNTRPAKLLVDAIPAASVATFFTLRVFTESSLPIDYPQWWRASAAIPAVICAWSALRTRNGTIRMWAGIVSVCWFMAWAAMLIVGYVQGDTLAARLSVNAISQYFLLAVLIAWSFGRRPHPVSIL